MNTKESNPVMWSIKEKYCHLSDKTDVFRSIKKYTDSIQLEQENHCTRLGRAHLLYTRQVFIGQTSATKAGNMMGQKVIRK